ncbi:MAG TPA: hypothetical protein VGE32_15510 [Cellvibrio sp.]
MKQPHPILANFLAPLIALMPMTIISVQALVVSDPLDDAPLKSSTFFFMAFPFLYFFIVVFSHFHGKFLLSFGFIPLKKLLISTAIVILLLAIPFALLLSNPDKYGIKDIYFAYATIAGLILISALPSAAFWWYMVCKPLKKLPNK